MKKYLFALVAMATMTTNSVNAQTKQATDFGLGTIFVNENVTTHLVMPETIRLVDISTDTIVGNQVNDNIVRLKPKCGMSDYDEAGCPVSSGISYLYYTGCNEVYRTVLGYAVLPESRRADVRCRDESLCYPYVQCQENGAKYP